MASGKHRPERRIDRQPANPFGVVGGDNDAASGFDQAAPPLPPAVPAPTLTSLTPSLRESAVTPSALIQAVWTPLETNDSESYKVQVSTSSTFASDVTTFATGQNQANAILAPLKVNTLYYVRVQTVFGETESAWSNTLSATTPTDTTVPGVPTSTGATFAGIGDLVITWTNPSSANFRDVEISIYSDATKTTQYALILDATGRYVWPAAQNLAATSGAGDPTVYVELRSRSWNNVYSALVVVGTITKAAPAAPGTIVQSWSGDTGAAAADWTISWAAQSDAAYYLLNINGLGARRVYGNTYTYTLDKNTSDNSAADPTLAYSVIAVDGLNQSSSATSGTATNAAPATTSATLFAGFSTVGITITPSTAADLKDYTVRIVKDGSTAATYHTTSPNQIYNATAPGSYQVGVIVNDVFGQSSSETVSSAVAVDALTITELRAESIYTDSISTDYTSGSNATVLKDDATGAGITYSSSASAYRWTQIEYPLKERFRRVSVKLGSGSANFYIATSPDGTTWRWFAGVGGDGYTLTERASEAIAQSNVSAVSALTNGWAELPATIEARYIKLYHRNTSSSYRLDEFYGYTLVIADMIRAGDIKAIHIAAGTITGDRLTATAIDGFTITGSTIQTASSGARVVLSSAANGGLIGYGSSDTYDPAAGTGTYQILWKKADGKFYFGAGNGVADENGIGILADTSGVVGFNNSIAWYSSAWTGNVAQVFGQVLSGKGWITVTAWKATASNEAVVQANGAGSGTHGAVKLSVNTSSNVNATARLLINQGDTVGTFTVDNADVVAKSGVNVGTATGATAGQVRASGGLLPPRSSGAALFGIDATNQGSTLVIANNGTANPFGNANNFSGILIVNDTNITGSCAVFIVGAAITKIAESSGANFTTTSGTAGKINVFFNATPALTIENKNGSSITFSVFGLRTRTQA